MIHCVWFSDVERHLAEIGFVLAGRTEHSLYFTRGTDEFVIRAANVHGYLPETLVDLAFESAGLAPPSWSVFWSD